MIYVGKAKTLRQRLNSYFADFPGLHPRTQIMLTTTASVDWTMFGTEVEALQQEFSWTEEFDPRFTSSTATTSPTPTWRSPSTRSTRG